MSSTRVFSECYEIGTVNSCWSQRLLRLCCKNLHFSRQVDGCPSLLDFVAKHRQRISKRISGRTEKVTGQQTTCVLPWVVAAAAAEVRAPPFSAPPRAICQKPRRNSNPRRPLPSTGRSPGGRGGRDGGRGGRGTFPELYSIDSIPMEDARRVRSNPSENLSTLPSFAY